MNTIVTEDIALAASLILKGELVAFPTETVFGLGADATNGDAVAALFEAKERPADNPIIVHVAARSDVAHVAAAVPSTAERFMRSFFPGPLTLILERHPNISSAVSAGLSTVGVRMPENETARALVAAAARPIAAPSANRSGRPSPTTWEAVREDLGGRIACILKGAPVRIGLESTVVDCTTEVPCVLRPGGIALEALQTVVPETKGRPSGSDGDVRSPGTRYRHYAPRGRVVVVETAEGIASPEGAAYLGLSIPEEPQAFAVCEVVPDAEAYARRLYEFLRECDRAGIETIYCERVEPAGLGTALMDRLERASRG